MKKRIAAHRFTLYDSPPSLTFNFVELCFAWLIGFEHDQAGDDDVIGELPQSLLSKRLVSPDALNSAARLQSCRTQVHGSVIGIFSLAYGIHFEVESLLGRGVEDVRESFSEAGKLMSIYISTIQF